MPVKRTLRNLYVLVRHGRSEANEAGIIVSDPVLGEEKYDLTTEGRTQVDTTADALAARYAVSGAASVQIYSSPFLRTRTTASILHERAFPTSPDPIVDDRLCERFFGMWDGKPDSNYQQIWDEDITENLGTLNNWGCESADEVANRAWSFIQELEAESTDPDGEAVDGVPPPKKVCLLVAHGDVLQILQTCFLDVPSWKHRSLEHLETAGWFVPMVTGSLIVC